MSTSHELTPAQHEAVRHGEGPLLILAGPGSGKTRVITHRIAALIEQGVHPGEILAITFTNKAATEMSDRVAKLLPGKRIWISTFHRFCARLLRQKAEYVGLQSNYSILDTGDQQALIREVLRDLDFDTVHFPPRKIAARISRAKNDLMSAEQYVEAFGEAVGDYLQAVTAQVYPAYQRRLLESNAVDFDDLLIHVATLLSENPELRRSLDERFRFTLVDEYQDTNLAQYRIVAALSQDHPNLCATGDPDQSIYGWRGAQIDNILRFETDYPQARVIRLEQNFRSTKNILQAADSLIGHNQYRKAKSLITDNPLGKPVELLKFRDGRQEADVIAARIAAAVEAGKHKYSDFAVFYRVNSLSREIELALTRRRVPFQIIAGLAFYDRAEIKDLLAFLRLIANPADRAAYLRVVNKPLRGIGKSTQNRLLRWADRLGHTPLEAAAQAENVPDLSKRAVKSLHIFAQLITELSQSTNDTVEELLLKVIDRTGYTRALVGSPSEDDVQRLANIQEFISAAKQYDEGDEERRGVEGFLETASLVADVDRLDASAGSVTLMTLHAAKGLEFPVVYLVAVEHNLIPHERSLSDGSLREVEEERRLLFVGMTRAKQQLYLTETNQRNIHGRSLATIHSDFLTEMDLVQTDLSIDDGMLDWHADDFSEFDDEASQVEPPPSAKKAALAKHPLLTTGAALLKGEIKAVEIPQSFTTGMSVRHPRYGLGHVVNTGGFGKRRTVTVEFRDDERCETFSVAHCPLQPVGRN